MSKSRESSLGSAASYAKETTDSSFLPSDLSFGSTASEKADNMAIILSSFIPEEYIPSNEDLEEAIKDLDSTRFSLASGDIEEEIAQVSEGIEGLIAEDIEGNKRMSPSSSSTNPHSLFTHNVEFFRFVVDKLNLGRFLYGISDESIKEQYEILGRDIEFKADELMSLRPEVTGMDKAQLKKYQKAEGALTTEGRIVRAKLPKKTVAEVKKEEAKERSDLKAIRTYEKNCMGVFNFVASESGELIVSADSTIDRPTNITGNLGRVAGDHVVPLAMLTKHLQRMVQGKEVYEAIKSVQRFAAGITEVEISKEGEEYIDQNSFHSVIERARGYEAREEQDPRPAGYISINDFNASNFLRSDLIPSTIRTWNMQTRAAFLGKKTKQELGTEGNKVKSVLKDLLASEKENSSPLMDTASSFISVIDYSPVGEGDDRGNGVQQLTLVIGSIIDANHLINDQNAVLEEELDQEHSNILSAEDIFNKMLIDCGWLKHYKDNPQDLDPVLSTEDDALLRDEYIKKVIMKIMLEQYPHLQDELDYKTQVKKEELEKDNYIVQDVPRDGNCFFHAIALQTNHSQGELRARAIAEINSNPDRYEGFVPRRDLSAYVSRMANDREWADNIMIQAVANSLEQNIEIFNRNGSFNTIIDVNPLIAAQPTTLRVLYTGNHYMSIIGGAEVGIDTQSRKRDREDASIDSSHLVRSEKGILSEVKEERQFMYLLTRDLTKEERIIFQEIKDSTESVPISSGSDLSSVSNPFVQLIPEYNHQKDHKQNILNLSKMLDDGVIKSNTVICLERKEDGNNFGMKDVKLLAAILRHNDKNESLPIDKSIRASAIYQDAMLYNKAQARGIEVVGIEGKSLQHNKDSPHYDQTREKYMADKINQLTASGKNVILPVGSAHVVGLKEKLKGPIIISDKSKAAEEQVATIVANIRTSLQEVSTSSFSQVVSVPQNKKDTKQTQRF